MRCGCRFPPTCAPSCVQLKSLHNEKLPLRVVVCTTLLLQWGIPVPFAFWLCLLLYCSVSNDSPAPPYSLEVVLKSSSRSFCVCQLILPLVPSRQLHYQSFWKLLHDALFCNDVYILFLLPGLLHAGIPLQWCDTFLCPPPTHSTVRSCFEGKCLDRAGVLDVHFSRIPVTCVIVLLYKAPLQLSPLLYIKWVSSEGQWLLAPSQFVEGF